MIPAGADVEGDGIRLPVEGREGHGAGDIGHVGQVAALVAVPVHPDRLAPEEGVGEGGQGQVPALAFAPDGEEAEGHEADAVESAVEGAPLFPVELGEGVGAQGVRRNRFLGRTALVVPVDAGGRGEDELANAVDAAELQQSHRAAHVRFLVVERAVDGGTDPGEGSQVDHGIEGLLREGIGAEVAAEVGDSVGVVVHGRTEVEGGHLMAKRGEVPDDVLADEAGRAGDEDLEGRLGHGQRRRQLGLTGVSIMIRFAGGLTSSTSITNALLPDRGRERTRPGLVEEATQIRSKGDWGRYSRGSVEVAGWEATR